MSHLRTRSPAAASNQQQHHQANISSSSTSSSTSPNTTTSPSSSSTPEPITLCRLILGYAISLTNTFLYFTYLYFSQIHITILSTVHPWILYLIMMSFSVSCTLGLYLLVTNKRYTENDAIIVVMTIFGVVGWSLMLRLFWNIYENFWLASLVTLWSFMSFGMLIGILWPRNVGWKGTRFGGPVSAMKDSKRKVHEL